jgi:hypothetical protein
MPLEVLTVSFTRAKNVNKKGRLLVMPSAYLVSTVFLCKGEQDAHISHHNFQFLSHSRDFSA